MTAASILIFDKCLYLRGRLQLTTAIRLSTYMSSKALATTTPSITIITSSVAAGFDRHGMPPPAPNPDR